MNRFNNISEDDASWHLVHTPCPPSPLVKGNCMHCATKPSMHESHFEPFCKQCGRVLNKLHACAICAIKYADEV